MKPTLFIHIPRTAGTKIKNHALRFVDDFKVVHEGRLFLPNARNVSGAFVYAGHTRVGPLLGRKILSREWYENCFRFTFVRNPWDRLTSIYRYYYKYRYIDRHKKFTDPKFDITRVFLSDFDTFVRAVVSDNWLGGLYTPPMDRSIMFAMTYSQLEWLRWGVDFVGRYENLNADWKKLCGLIGMKHKPLPVHPKWKLKPWREQYIGNLRELVADFYAEEIEHFGYEFNE